MSTIVDKSDFDAKSQSLVRAQSIAPSLFSVAETLPAYEPTLSRPPVFRASSVPSDAMRRLSPPPLALTLTPFPTFSIEPVGRHLDRGFERPEFALDGHDVNQADWNSFFDDIQTAARLDVKKRVLAGVLPSVLLGWPGIFVTFALLRRMRMKKRGLVVAVIDVWNEMFFAPRGVQVILYSGQRRLTGSAEGNPEIATMKVKETEKTSELVVSDKKILDQSADNLVTSPYRRSQRSRGCCCKSRDDTGERTSRCRQERFRMEVVSL